MQTEVVVTNLHLASSEALKRFKRKCQKDNIMGDLRRKEFYEKPSVRRKKKSEQARKRGSKN